MQVYGKGARFLKRGLEVAVKPCIVAGYYEPTPAVALAFDPNVADLAWWELN
jgi:hypothetical protein